MCVQISHSVKLILLEKPLSFLYRISSLLTSHIDDKLQEYWKNRVVPVPLIFLRSKMLIPGIGTSSVTVRNEVLQGMKNTSV